jgi:putative SOS response-associated peptidase YedK
VESSVHITMPANALIKEIHNAGNNPYRMPAILRKEDQEAWLSGTLDDARAMLKQYEAGLMVAYEVSTRVNTPTNNDAALIESVQSTVGDSAGGENLSFL